MGRERFERAARLLRVLGNAARLEIVAALLEGSRTVGELGELVGLSQPLVSQHLRVLREVGLVAVAVEGRSRRYSVADEHVRHVVRDALVHSDEPAPDAPTASRDRRSPS